MKHTLFLLFAGCVRDYELLGYDGEMVVQPSRLLYGQLAESGTGVESFTIRNTGKGPLFLTDLIVEGGPFTLVDGLGDMEIRPGDERAVEIAYTPQSPRDHGTVTIRARDQDEAVVSLYGGIDVPEATFAPGGTVPSVEVVDVGETIEIPLVFTARGSLDLAFLLDTTQSMNALAEAVTEEFQDIALDLAREFADGSWGLATYEDYSRYPFGSAGVDTPFRLRAAQTTNREAIQAALGEVTINEGQDAPEATLEAIYQGMTGRGYDLDCDGVYDEGYDVLPYRASGDDPFGGLGGQAGGEGLGGFGFRPGRIPIVVYATNYELRDADDERYETPQGCPSDVGMAETAAAIDAMGGRVVGVAAHMAPTSYAVAQMEALAAMSSSMADLDGDGAVEPAVVVWSGSSGEFRDTVVDAVTQLSASMRWSAGIVEVDDPLGLVASISPEVRHDIGSGDTVRFTATLTGVPLDEPEQLTFRLVGTGGVELGTTVVIIRNAY